MNYPLLKDAEIKGKRVLLRAGFDVPMEGGKVVDTSRIEAIVPTMQHIIQEGAMLIILAHQGRPTPLRRGSGGQEGKKMPELSQKPLVSILEKLLGATVKFSEDCVGEGTEALARELKPGEVLLLENLRFEEGEKNNDPEFAKKLASLAQVYVNDAFPNCHREHASMVGIPKHLPSYMGLQLQDEVENLSTVLDDPRRPVTLIVSGVKMETKVPVIERFLEKGDDILLGGCIANTFIAARGFDVGTSKYEPENINKAQEIMLESEKEEDAMVHVPRDVVLATEPKDHAEKVNLPVESIAGDMSIFDIGKVTVERYKEVIAKSGTIIWNGPLGYHEVNRFSHATKRIAEAIAEATKSGALSIVGGGDTIDFHRRYGYPLDAYTFVSTGGGAMLEFLSGKELPALKALKNS